MILYLVNINLHMGQMPLSACDQITMSLSWLRPQRKASSHHKRTLQKMNLNPSGSLEELDKLELGQGQARAGGKHRNLWTGLQPLVILLQTSTLSLKTLCEYFMIGIFNVLCVSSQSPSGFQRTQLSLFFFWGGGRQEENVDFRVLWFCVIETRSFYLWWQHIWEQSVPTTGPGWLNVILIHLYHKPIAWRDLFKFVKVSPKAQRGSVTCASSWKDTPTPSPKYGLQFP